MAPADNRQSGDDLSFEVCNPGHAKLSFSGRPNQCLFEGEPLDVAITSGEGYWRLSATLPHRG